MLTPDQNQIGEERVYFSLQISGYRPSLRVVREGTQGRDLEAGREVEFMEECCSLPCFLCLANFAFLYTQNQLLRCAVTLNSLGSLTSITS